MSEEDNSRSSEGDDGRFMHGMNGEQFHGDNGQPFVTIKEQPQTRGFRFRYKCEGGSHGGLQGVTSSRSKKTYPTIQIHNFNGPAKILVRLVTDEEQPKPHAHELVGKNCQNGICTVNLKPGPNMEASFPNLSVLHVTKKKVVEILQQRKLEEIKMQKVQHTTMHDLNEIKASDKDRDTARLQAENEAKDMSLNVVRLCFEVYLMDESGTYSRRLKSVVSNKICDNKSPAAAGLKICRMDKHAGCCTGNEEVFLLCDKVQKDDIAVRFYEEDNHGRVTWQGTGEFGPADVHKQYAIVFKTPCYRDTDIQNPVQVKVQLRRLTDDEKSDAKPFTYYPQQIDREEIGRKRKKLVWGTSLNQGTTDQTGGLGINGTSQTVRSANTLDPNAFNQGDTGRTMTSYNDMPQEIVNNQLNNQMGMPLQQIQPIGSEISDLQTDSAPEFLDFSLAPPFYGQDFGIPPMMNPEFHYQPYGLTPRCAFQKGQDVGEIPKDQGKFEEDAELDTKEEMAEGKTKDIEPENLNVKEENINVKLEKNEKMGVSVQDSSITSTRTSTHWNRNTDTGINIARKIAEKTALAVQDYAKTGQMKYLMIIQRYLVAIQDDNGDTALHLSVIHRQADALRNLLDVIKTIPSNNYLNMFNSLRQTPLHLAVITTQPIIVNWLLEDGAKMEPVDRHGNTATHLAAMEGNERCLQMLLRCPRSLESCLENPFPETHVLNFDGYSPLHLACMQGSLQNVKLLCAVKAPVNQQDGKSGRTPLHHAVEGDFLAIAGHLLLEAQVDVNIPSYDGNTALHIACGRKNYGMAALLMAAGADPEAENAEVSSDEDIEEDQGDLIEESSDEKEPVGQTPFDLAYEDDKLLNILRGEAYASDSYISLNPTDTRSWRMTSDRVDSGVGFQSGNLRYLDAMTRAKLAKLLDQNKPEADWKALLKHLDVDKSLDIFQMCTSPTQALLNHFETTDGTIDDLKRALEKIQRTDAIKILDQELNLGKRQKQSEKEKDSQEKLESGIESMKLESVN